MQELKELNKKIEEQKTQIIKNIIEDITPIFKDFEIRGDVSIERKVISIQCDRIQKDEERGVSNKVVIFFNVTADGQESIVTLGSSLSDNSLAVIPVNISYSLIVHVIEKMKEVVGTL